jgi:hypothetical protein
MKADNEYWLELRALLGVIGFYRIWIPTYAALARPLVMLLLIFLFGSCIINALSRFLSQQVQWIKVQLLVKEYSPLATHEPSIPFYLGPLENTQVNPWDKYHLSYSPLSHCQHEAGRWVIAPLPNSSWVLVSDRGLVGSGDLKQMSENPISPHGEHYDSCILKRRYRVW